MFCPYLFTYSKINKILWNWHKDVWYACLSTYVLHLKAVFLTHFRNSRWNQLCSSSAARVSVFIWGHLVSLAELSHWQSCHIFFFCIHTGRVRISSSLVFYVVFCVLLFVCWSSSFFSGIFLTYEFEYHIGIFRLSFSLDIVTMLVTTLSIFYCMCDIVLMHNCLIRKGG